eukprot:CAMPEP_0117559434 /NCGR_PEP_ID=MMETSP0784-20121206/53362_1 /TAXON_ID=39447 /ORGANISM="" /LENGTH=123 /DNA_ID=CAMNT_0005356819 /DNA_START=26 /DNA_END=397 /DNA_ORIENTATION=-
MATAGPAVWTPSEAAGPILVSAAKASNSVGTAAIGGVNAPETTCQQQIPGHERHTPRVDCAEVRVREKAHKELLGPFLERQQGLRFEAQTRLRELGADLAYHALERTLVDEKLRVSLIIPDLL